MDLLSESLLYACSGLAVNDTDVISAAAVDAALAPGPEGRHHHHHRRMLQSPNHARQLLQSTKEWECAVLVRAVRCVGGGLSGASDSP